MGLGNREVAGTLVVIVLIAQTLFMGPAVFLLDIVLLISFVLWAADRDPAPARRVLPVFIGAIVVQLLHFVEEYAAGFQRVFPAQFGYSWEDWRFVTFNTAWLTVFAGSIVAIALSQRLGYLGAYFLALAGIGNGIGHVALAVRAGGYFPGIYTAPASFILGAVLVARLLRDPVASEVHQPPSTSSSNSSTIRSIQTEDSC